MKSSRTARLGTIVAGLAVLGTLTACTGPASSTTATSASPVAEAAESRTVELPRLSADAAMEAATAALESCRASGVGFVTVSVVDRFGQVQAVVRGDGAAEHTLSASAEKGYTAAAFGANTSELTERLPEGGGATLRDLEGTLFLAGGVPIKVGTATIAGIGVGGAPDGMVDEGCAAAGAAVLAEDAAS